MTVTAERMPIEPVIEPVIDPEVYRRRWFVLSVLCLSLLVVGIDGTIVVVALPSFVRELGATQSELQWITDAYTIVFASLLLTAGSLGDRFGRKGSLLIGLVVFGIGSLASGLVDTPTALIFTRGVQGLGAAFIMPATLSILTNVFPAAERGRAIGIWAGVSGLGVAIGPLAGGWLLEHFWWGSIFLVNLPVIAFALVAVWTIVPDSRDPHAPRIDFPATVLSITALTALLYGVIEAPNHGWLDPQTLIAFGIATVLIVAFILWERHTPQPMLDVRFFKNPRFSAASIAITLVFFAMFGSLFFLTQYLQFVLGYSALKAGAALIPVAAALIIAAPLSASLVAHLGTKVVVTAGLLIVGSGFVLLSRATTTSGYGLIALVLAIIGIGMGTAMAPATDSIMGSLPPDKAGVGSAVNDTTREIGGALGIAVLGSITASAYQARIDESSVVQQIGQAGGAQGEAAVHAIRDSIGGAAQVTQQLAALEQAGTVPAGIARAVTEVSNAAFVHAMTRTVIIGAVIAGIGALVALIFLPSRPAMAAGVSKQVDDLAWRAGRGLSRSDAPDPIDAAGIGLLSQAGMSSLAFNGMAARSGIATAGGRNWGANFVRVVGVAYATMADQHVPDSGSLRTDVCDYLTQATTAMRTPEIRPVIVALLQASVEAPELTPALRSVLVEPRRRELVAMVERARARGEVRADVDAELLIDALLGPVYLRTLVTGGDLNPTTVDGLVDVVLDGVATPSETPWSGTPTEG
jgi:EmrB/QacA subfamily drug resistance transporter